jgi:predicted transposase YbfD/YdcC
LRKPKLPREVIMNYSTLAASLPQDVDGLIFDVGSLYARLLGLRDQRQRRGVRYALAVILVAVVLAKLAGQDKPKGIAEWVQLRKELFLTLFGLKRQRMPHSVTYERVLRRAIQPDDLDQLVQDFLTSAPTVGQAVHIALDGKTLRGVVALDRTRGLHLLAAYLPSEGVVLFQLAVDQKTNEITVAPHVLKMLDLKGKVVTGDALLTQRELSLQIVEAGGDYLWLAKGNQADLRRDIEQLFEPETCLPGTSSVVTDLRSAHTHEKNRSRIETRTLTASSLLAESSDWPHLAQVFKLTRVFRALGSDQVQTHVIYGLTSLTRNQASPAQLLDLVREHWGIENGLHYRRDVTLQEDRLRSTAPTLGHVMASLNNLVIGLAHRLRSTNLAQARRGWDAHPDHALRLIFSRLT